MCKNNQDMKQNIYQLMNLHKHFFADIKLNMIHDKGEYLIDKLYLCVKNHPEYEIWGPVARAIVCQYKKK